MFRMFPVSHHFGRINFQLVSTFVAAAGAFTSDPTFYPIGETLAIELKTSNLCASAMHTLTALLFGSCLIQFIKFIVDVCNLCRTCTLMVQQTLEQIMMGFFLQELLLYFHEGEILGLT